MDNRTDTQIIIDILEGMAQVQYELVVTLKNVLERMTTLLLKFPKE